MENALQPNPERIELYFSKGFDTTKGNLIKMNKSILEKLDNDGEIVIEGNDHDQLIVHTNKQSYCMKKINISTSSLVSDYQGIIHQQCSNFIELEHYDPPYNQISASLTSSLENIDFSLDNYEQFIETFSINVYQFKSKYKINTVQFQKLAKSMNIIVDRQAGKCLYLPKNVQATIMRNIIALFSQKNLFAQTLAFEHLSGLCPILQGQVLQSVVEYFEIPKSEGIFTITGEVIAQYIYLEMSLAKNQYTKLQFNELVDEMFTIYLPVQIERPSCPTKMYHYFIQTEQTMMVYDYMLFEQEIMSRLKFLNSIKKKWKIDELKALFRGIPAIERGNELEISNILLKKFRKFGDTYEIRMIMPK